MFAIGPLPPCVTRAGPALQRWTHCAANHRRNVQKLFKCDITRTHRDRLHSSSRGAISLRLADRRQALLRLVLPLRRQTSPTVAAIRIYGEKPARSGGFLTGQANLLVRGPLHPIALLSKTPEQILCPALKAADQFGVHGRITIVAAGRLGPRLNWRHDAKRIIKQMVWIRRTQVLFYK
jgi:hypothetical protein